VPRACAILTASSSCIAAVCCCFLCCDFDPECADRLTSTGFCLFCIFLCDGALACTRFGDFDIFFGVGIATILRSRTRAARAASSRPACSSMEPPAAASRPASALDSSRNKSPPLPFLAPSPSLLRQGCSSPLVLLPACKLQSSEWLPCGSADSIRVATVAFFALFTFLTAVSLFSACSAVVSCFISASPCLGTRIC